MTVQFINIIFKIFNITFIKKYFLLIIVFTIFSSNNSFSSQFTSLYTMNGGAGDGYIPDGNLVFDGTWLYGTNNNDFFGGYGTIFKIKPDGTGFTKIHQFNGTGDERQPRGLILIGSTLYGIAKAFGSFGIIYKINTDGTGYSILLQFDGANNGKSPVYKLIYYGSQLYGATFFGGVNDSGVIFKINLDGTGYTKLHESVNWLTEGVNYGDIEMIGGTIYGIAIYGGACSCGNGGTLFKINSDGTGYQTLVDFNNSTPSVGVYGGSVTVVDNKLYGSTNQGLTNNLGSIFSVNTDGTNLNRLLIKGGSNPTIDYLTGYNNNGTYVLIGNSIGGTYGQGTFFWMNTDGSNYNVMNQTHTANGGFFSGAMLNYNNVIYGNLSNGGNVVGEVYKFILPTTPNLTISQASSISYNTANLNANISDDGYGSITSRGFVWSTSANPTISNYLGISSNSTGTTPYAQSMTNLSSKTTYYVRAYSSNFVGTSYSSEINFTTVAAPEDYAPNNGDGNDDGIPDSQQSEVESIFNANTNKYITIVSLNGNRILNPEVLLPNDYLNYYPGSLVKFSVNASIASIKIYYHNVNSLNSYTFRKLNSQNTLFNFTNCTFGSEVIDGKIVATATLTLTDGGPEDYDGVVNGSITDPGGPAILATDANIPVWDWKYLILLISLISISLYKHK